MRPLVVSATVVALSAAGVALGLAQGDDHEVSSTTTTVASNAACDDIHIAPNSSNMAFNIKSETLGYPDNPAGYCGLADVLIRTVATEHSFVSSPREFRSGTWQCSVTTDEGELPVGHYTCYLTGHRVTWDKT